MLPSQATPFLLTLAISSLIGIGLREYYESEAKYDTFGTVRTFVFLGMLGFMLYQIPDLGRPAFLLGMAAVVPFLLVYYNHKVRQKKSPGLIGVFIALLTYTTGPVAIHQPHWFLVLFAVSILFVLHSKGRIRRLTDRLETGEVVTVCKFLAIAGVILPVIPAVPPTVGMVGRIFTILPVTPRQIWVAVVITTTISYLGYVFQTYLYPKRGLLLTGIIGGVYSSTAAVVVISKKSKHQVGNEREATAAILLAVSMMYLRILALVAIFRLSAVPRLLPVFLGLSALAAGYALWLRRMHPNEDVATPEEPSLAQESVEAEAPMHRNPLELNSAFIFATMFVVVALVTKYTLIHFKDMGLRMLSFVVGVSDITPFVISVLQGNLSIGEAQIFQAVIIATASNNFMKAGYTFIFGNRATAWMTTKALVALSVLSLIYALVGV